jgi:hypothetical protein
MLHCVQYGACAVVFPVGFGIWYTKYQQISHAFAAKPDESRDWRSSLCSAKPTCDIAKQDRSLDRGRAKPPKLNYRQLVTAFLIASAMTKPACVTPPAA